MASTLFTVGPYMVRMACLFFEPNHKEGSSLLLAQDMLVDGMLMPEEQHEDGTLIWNTPAGK